MVLEIVIRVLVASLILSSGYEIGFNWIGLGYEATTKRIAKEVLRLSIASAYLILIGVPDPIRAIAIPLSLIAPIVMIERMIRWIWRLEQARVFLELKTPRSTPIRVLVMAGGGGFLILTGGLDMLNSVEFPSPRSLSIFLLGLNGCCAGISPLIGRCILDRIGIRDLHGQIRWQQIESYQWQKSCLNLFLHSRRKSSIDISMPVTFSEIPDSFRPRVDQILKRQGLQPYDPARVLPSAAQS